MRREIEEIPEATARLLDGSATVLTEAGRGIREREPSFVVTVARGSSDHAATFMKYAVELTAGLAVASVGPSIASIYGAKLRLAGSACLAISQSGKSPDIVAMRKKPRWSWRPSRPSEARRLRASRTGEAPAPYRETTHSTRSLLSVSSTPRRRSSRS